MRLFHDRWRVRGTLSFVEVLWRAGQGELAFLMAFRHGKARQIFLSPSSPLNVSLDVCLASVSLPCALYPVAPPSRKQATEDGIRYCPISLVVRTFANLLSILHPYESEIILSLDIVLPNSFPPPPLPVCVFASSASSLPYIFFPVSRVISRHPSFSFADTPQTVSTFNTRPAVWHSFSPARACFPYRSFFNRHRFLTSITFGAPWT